MQNIVFILAGIVATLEISAITLYVLYVLKKTTSPRIASWYIWIPIAILNAASYVTFSMDFIKGIVPVLSALGGVATLVLLFLRVRSREVDLRLDVFDKSALIVGLGAVAVWWYFHSAAYANIILQGSVTIGFLPTYRGLLKNPKNEQPLPWALWTVGHALAVVIVILRWNGKYAEFVYPAWSSFLHLVVLILSRRTIQV